MHGADLRQLTIFVFAQHAQAEVGVLQRTVEGLQQRLEEADKDRRQTNDLNAANATKVKNIAWALL